MVALRSFFTAEPCSRLWLHFLSWPFLGLFFLQLWCVFWGVFGGFFFFGWLCFICLYIYIYLSLIHTHSSDCVNHLSKQSDNIRFCNNFIFQRNFLVKQSGHLWFGLIALAVILRTSLCHYPECLFPLHFSCIHPLLTGFFVFLSLLLLPCLGRE